ncbi:vascular endothelial growth factor B isoform X2 [Heterocephalus glaber]|uniref:Vascular endothelial growth factor B n=1 Tax=Heterocephalus glaber TaxID=10181 RepID=A0AAX6TKB7_HETGA|nr:vascular endothelial growth factor B isoform X2 [Heterocephalus glaber]
MSHPPFSPGRFPASPPPPLPATVRCPPGSSGRRRRAGRAALPALRDWEGAAEEPPPAPGPRPPCPGRRDGARAAAPRTAGLGQCGCPRRAAPVGAMRPLLRHLLLAAILQLAPAQAPVSQPDGPGHQKKEEEVEAEGLLGSQQTGLGKTVVSWIDVYARATCQPREVVVPLTMELMGTVAKQLVPSCMTVQRCGGCCPDDGLECVPTGQHQVRMQVLMIRYPSSQLGEMSLEEHSQCECRPKKRESAMKSDSPRPLCPRCSQRRQHPDPWTCHCRCRRHSFLRCQGWGLELNPDTCRCRKLRR